MYTIEQFENALLQINVEIDEMKMKGKYVRRAIGYINPVSDNRKRLIWKENGECYNNNIDRAPKYDLKFE